MISVVVCGVSTIQLRGGGSGLGSAYGGEVNRLICTQHLHIKSFVSLSSAKTWAIRWPLECSENANRTRAHWTFSSLNYRQSSFVVSCSNRMAIEFYCFQWTLTQTFISFSLCAIMTGIGQRCLFRSEFQISNPCSLSRKQRLGLN